MTGFRASVSIVAVAAWALAAFPAPSPAQTEDTGPRSIIPAAGELEATVGTDTAEDERSPPAGLEVESLGEARPPAPGALDVAHGGLGMDLWYRSDPRLVASRIAALPAGNGSAVSADLARRLLLSVAWPPEGMEADLLALRIAALARLGLAEDVAALVASAGPEGLTGAVLRALSDARFLLGEVDFGCHSVGEAVALLDDADLQMAFVFCQRLAGQEAAAELGLALLRDGGAALGSRFVALDAALARGRPGELESLERASPLILAMARAGRAPIPPALLAPAPPAIQRALAEDPALDMELRLAAGELAAARAAMPGAALAQLYESVPFAPEAVADALARAADLEPARGRALLFQASRRRVLPSARAEALGVLLRQAEGGGAAAYLAAARAVGADLAALDPGGELAWFAVDASRALLLAGRIEAAARWWPLLRERGAAGDRARLAALWPLLRLAFGEQLPDDGERMTAWWHRADAAEPGRLELATTLLASFAALDDGAGDMLLPELLAHEVRGGGGPAETGPRDVVGLLALHRAARGGRLGETVVLALDALGPRGPAGADPVTLRAAIAALRTVGLEREARALALEAGAQRLLGPP